MGAEEKSPSSNISMQRVKVYRLNDEGRWDDQGTGNVTVDYLERSEELGIFVLDEDDNETLLLHRISSDDIYRKQEDTIISWRDPEYATELALSFQENTGCSYIWDHICNVQRNMHFSTLNSETFHNVNSELRELPPVELSTLPLILKIIVESGITDQLRVTDLLLHDQEFIPKLMDLFRICEDLENIDGLHMIFKIVRGIILLNSPQILEIFFGDEHIMDVIGCLEYDPDVPHVHHRDFLKEHVVYKEAIPIKDPLVLSKIHQTYRVGYLKDVILPRVLDDSIVANLNTTIHSNNAMVVSLLKDDNTFIQELFARLKSSSTSAESKKNLVLILHEFCNLSKSLQMVQQLRLYRDLVNEGIFDIIADILQCQDKKLVLIGTDILILFLSQDPNLLRSYVTRQEGIPLFGLLVKGMLTDFEDDMHCQFLEILRNLMDSYASTASGSQGFVWVHNAFTELGLGLRGKRVNCLFQKETIVEIFYERHLGQLIDVITSSCSPNTAQTVSNSARFDGGTGNPSSVKPEILLNICDLLCFCVLHHPYRIKCNFLLNNVIEKVLFLTHRREKYLVVAAVRFIRTLISRNDEHLMNHIVRNNILKPIVDAFVANGDCYNLLNSAVLELFEYILKENLRILLKYLVDTFWEQLVKFDNLPSIRSLRVRYEQALESTVLRNHVSVSDPRKRLDERALEKEEEDYFNEDSDEEDSASASAPMPKTNRVRSQPVLSNGSASSYPSVRPGGLVDYDDDEDDEDYKPPPRKQSDNSGEGEVEESIRLKRKSTSKEEPESKRLQRSPKSPKPKEGVFAALCSTLSHAVLPSKKAASTAAEACRSDTNKNSVESKPEEKEHGSDVDDKRAEVDNHTEKDPNKNSVESKPEEKEHGSDVDDKRAEVDNHTEKETSSAPRHVSDDLHDHPSSGPTGDDCPLIPPNSSPEMTVNGS